MVPETYRWGEYNSGGRFSVFSRDLSAKALARNSKGYQGGGDPVCEPCFLEWSEGASEVNKLQSAKAAGREIGGFMLAITGATRLYYVAGFTDMRYGKYALANVVRYQLHRNPYNGDGYMFMSKDCQKMKILVYSHNLYRLYDLSYDKGLSFMKIENEDGTPVKGCKSIDWKYLVALLNCPVRKKLIINSN